MTLKWFEILTNFCHYTDTTTYPTLPPTTILGYNYVFMKLDTATLEPIWVKALLVSNPVASRSISGLASNANGDLFISGNLGEICKFHLKKHGFASVAWIFFNIRPHISH